MNKLISKSDIKNYLYCEKMVMDGAIKEEYSILSLKYGDYVQGIARTQIKKEGEYSLFIPYTKPMEMLSETKKGIYNKNINLIYEATFHHNGAMVRADVIRKVSDNEWDVIEIKSGTSITPDYDYDVAIQHHVIKNALNTLGLDIKLNFFIMYPNKESISGDFIISVADNEFILKEEANIENAIIGIKYSRVKKFEDEKFEFSPKCLKCPSLGKCFPHTKEPKSIVNIPRIRGEKVAELFSKGIIDITDKRIFGFITAKQAEEISKHSNREILHRKLNHEMMELLKNDGIGSLDFETLSLPIGSEVQRVPYERVCFQYSLKKIDGETLTGDDYLSPDLTIGSEYELIVQLLEDTKDLKTLVVFNEGFEKSVMKEWIQRFPELEVFINEMLSKVYDLLPVIRKNYCFSDGSFSYSLKNLAKDLFPETNFYKGLANGEDAQLEYFDYYIKLKEFKDIKHKLIAYCSADTLIPIQVILHFKNS